MQYIFDGEFYKIVKISGPKHNFLALSFGTDHEDVEVIDLDKASNTDILFFEVRSQVLFGIKEINRELGTDYRVRKIQFISSDSPSDSIYTELAKEIVIRLKAGGEFSKV